MKKSMLILAGVVGVGLASATDYIWLANPASSDWLTGVNWSTVYGDVAWSAGADDTATFGASSQTTVNWPRPRNDYDLPLIEVSL